jgi:hypothetical protein
MCSPPAPRNGARSSGGWTGWTAGGCWAAEGRNRQQCLEEAILKWLDATEAKYRKEHGKDIPEVPREYQARLGRKRKQAE